MPPAVGARRRVRVAAPADPLRIEWREIMKILTVDDDPFVLELIGRTLVREGYRVETALNGFEGLDKARENPPDVVILDWMLPKVNNVEMDGLEVCRRLRAAGPVPILMLTAKDSVENRVQGLDAGAKRAGRFFLSAVGLHLLHFPPGRVRLVGLPLAAADDDDLVAGLD